MSGSHGALNHIKDVTRLAKDVYLQTQAHIGGYAEGFRWYVGEQLRTYRMEDFRDALIDAICKEIWDEDEDPSRERRMCDRDRLELEGGHQLYPRCGRIFTVKLPSLQRLCSDECLDLINRKHIELGEDTEELRPKSPTKDEDDQPLFTIAGIKLEKTIAYPDRTAGRSRVRKVLAIYASNDQLERHLRMCEVQHEADGEAIRQKRVALSTAMVRASGDLTARLYDCRDR